MKTQNSLYKRFKIFIFRRIKTKWKLAFNTLPLIVLVIVVKLIIHYFNIEFLSLNALFTALISANIFLIGFLISGTLSDYKESEKLPGDIANAIQSMGDEAFIILKNKDSKEAKEYIHFLMKLSDELVNWFHKKTKTEEIYNMIFQLNEYHLKFEPQTQANFIVRMKNEQTNLRRIVTRIHTIRETSFLGAGYAIAEIITGIIIFGLVFLKLDPFHEKMYFVSFVSFILIYMIFFIKDLDNPFSYYQDDGLVEEVSLKPVLDVKERLQSFLDNQG
ncbi:hypothetical protein EBU91_02405 [bacterium]|nr:hypothetical protein [bacterium]